MSVAWKVFWRSCPLRILSIILADISQRSGFIWQQSQDLVSGVITVDFLRLLKQCLVVQVSQLSDCFSSTCGLPIRCPTVSPNWGKSAGNNCELWNKLILKSQLYHYFWSPESNHRISPIYSNIKENQLGEQHCHHKRPFWLIIPTK